MTPVELVLSKLTGVIHEGSQWKAKCPSHDDRHQSLSISEGADGKAILNCHANCGCTATSITAVIGLELKHLFVKPEKGGKERLGPILTTYSYTDELGTELYQVTRHVPKTFRQRRPSPGVEIEWTHVGSNGRPVRRKEPYAWGLGGARRVLFHLPRLVAARDGHPAFGVAPIEGSVVWLPEGEKDVLALEAAGVIATTNAMGAKSWRADYAEQLRGCHVVIVRDRDESGYNFVETVYRSILGVALSVRVVEAKEGKDAADHLAAGFTIADFVDVDPLEKCPEHLLSKKEPSKEAKAVRSGKAPIAQGVLDELGKDDLPMIETNDRQLRDVTNDAFTCLLLANDPPSVFVRGAELVRVTDDENGRATIQAVSGDIRTGVLARCANWISTSQKRGCISVRPPESVVKDLSVLAPWPGIPALIAVSPCPVVATDGSILKERGYHAGARTFVAIEGRWPTFIGGGKAAAKWILDEVLVDFPFAKDENASVANALSLMLTPFVRPLISSTVPFFLFDAPVAGTGKTWCAQACMYPGLGLIEAKAPPSKEEEWGKVITTTLSAGVPALLVDNIVGKLESPSFMAVLTSLSWQDRLMGKNTVLMSLPNRCIYVGTANNATLEEDFLSRTVPVRLDAGRERPQERTNFQHPNLMEWLAANRAKMGAACLAMIETWVEAGMPNGERKHSRFGSWAEVLGGILAACEVEGFLTNLERLHEANDDEHILWSQFLLEWRTAFPGREATVAELYERLSESETLKTIVGSAKDDEAKRKRLGMMLNHRIDRVYGDTSIHRGARSKTGRRFKLTIQGDTNVTNSLFGGQHEEVSEQTKEPSGAGESDTPYKGPTEIGSSASSSTDRFKGSGDTTDLVSPDTEVL